MLEDKDYTENDYDDICDFIDSMTPEEVFQLQKTISIVIAKKNDNKILPIYHDTNILH